VGIGQRQLFCGACKGEHSAKDTKRCPVARQQWQLAKQLHNDRQIFFPERAQIPPTAPAPATLAPASAGPAPAAAASATPASDTPSSAAPSSAAPGPIAPASAPAPAPEQRPQIHHTPPPPPEGPPPKRGRPSIVAMLARPISPLQRTIDSYRASPIMIPKETDVEMAGSHMSNQN